MLTERVILLIVVISDVSCQIDGEFWWLNNAITNLKHGTAPLPEFDDVNELDTDETAKVVFREIEEKKGKSLKSEQETINAIHFRDETELTKPIIEFDKLNANNKIWKTPLKKNDSKKDISLQNPEDEFRFVFPSDDNTLWTDGANKNKSTLIGNNIESPSKISFVPMSSDTKNPLHPENICTYITKFECIRNEGTLYDPGLKPIMKISIPNTEIICCILPITTTRIAKIIFPDNYWDSKRHKRSSVDDESPALKQRNALMNRKYSLDNQKIRVTTPATRKKVNQKYDSDEHSIDPYWNIKNSNIRHPDIPTYQDPDSEYDYGGQSYGDDYTVELPKPGLVGLYSDHKQTQLTWMNDKNKDFYYNAPDSVEEEFETSFGYSTIDPRQDHRLTSTPSKPLRRRPTKLTTPSSKVPEPNLYDPIITFHSNPDFQVLQGFKLLNLVRSKNRFVRKTTQIDKECADSGSNVPEKPPKLINNLDDRFEHDVRKNKLKEQLFNECGKTLKNHDDCDSGRQQGVVDFGGHPWIALVVLTKSENSVICYATIVHSRVAVSIADCVNGKEVSVIAGVLNLDEDLAQSQRRMATITLDAEYTPGNLEHNVALLHWLRPLKFDATVQPACLTEPLTHEICVFVGWGGYDQEMQSDLRWQRASILAPQNCNKLLSKLEVSDALCAAVESRGTVTGVGGPLLCRSDERWSAVGVAVWRDDIVIVLPQREWVMRIMISLSIK